MNFNKNTCKYDNFHPLVSIIIPVYCQTGHLREAIESALSQTYTNIEVLVVNSNFHNNNIKNTILSFGAKLKYFETGNGNVNALNLGLRKMEGEYFSVLWPDDVYLEEKTEIQVNDLLNSPNKNIIIYGGWYQINTASTITGVNNLSDNHRIVDLNKPLYPVFNEIILLSSLLIPKTCILDVGTFNESLNSTQNYDLLYRILKRYPILYQDEVLTKHRENTLPDSHNELPNIGEINDLWLNFINDGNDSIIKRFTFSHELYYLKIAAHLKQKGINDAFKFAASKYNEINHSVIFSIILPTYNRSYCICEAIESVLNQTVRNYEIIVVDDGSVDDTVQVLEKYKGKITYLYQKNQGVSAARNLGLSKASGKYVAFIDSDDLWTNDHLAKHLNLLENNLEYAMSFNYAKTIDYKTGRFKRKVTQKKFDREIKYPKTLFISENYITTPSVVIRKCILEETGIFDERMDMCEDLDLWRRISLTNRIICMPEYLTVIRERENHTNPTTFFLKRKLFLEKAIANDPKLNRTTIISLFLEMYKSYFSLGCDTNILINDIIKTSKVYPELNVIIPKTGENQTWTFIAVNDQTKKETELLNVITLMLQYKAFRFFILDILLPVLNTAINAARKMKKYYYH